jgi:hypothetical protein
MEMVNFEQIVMVKPRVDFVHWNLAQRLCYAIGV